MLFIILGLIIGLLKGYGSWYGNGGVDGFLGAIIGFIIYLIGGSFIGAALPVDEVVTKQEICALNDGVETEGSYFLFSGYIDKKLTYRYVVNTDKGKHVESLDEDDDIYIKEGDYKPYVEYHKYIFKSDWYYWFAFNISSVDNYIIFYVPSNTVTNDYSIDLK